MVQTAISHSALNEPRKPFRAPRITEDMAAKIGELAGQGFLLHHALAALDPPITTEHWKHSCADPKHGGSLLRAFESKRSAGIAKLLAQVDPEVKGWQACAWKLERAHGYSVAKGPGVVVNVNTINGVTDDIWERAKQFVSAKQAKVKQITDT